MTVSVGASLFDDRFGLARAAKPAPAARDGRLPERRPRPREVCDGDLLAPALRRTTATPCLHALRDIARATRGGMQARWRGRLHLARPARRAAPRNLLGFKDGTANPAIPATPR